MRLVFIYHWCIPYEAEGTETIPFEYSSIEDFQFFVLEKIAEIKSKKDCFGYSSHYIELFGYNMLIEEIEYNINHIVISLEDWFDKKKISIK